MFFVWKSFSFSASHQLTHLPEGHQCARLHGHNYTVELELAAKDLNENGFVIDYGELAPFKNFINNTLDHRHLNEQMELVFTGKQAYATAENLAYWLFNVAAQYWGELVTACRVSETPNTWAEYRPRSVGD